ncbi:MAG: zinc ribbon domain-containing protein [Acidimicrobiia bacterium]|nr:zinc ribbon domain-containing protein [Acidimicrobiia bacterium]
MPLYDYRCHTCDTVFRELRPMRDADEPTTCPEGHVGATRLLPRDRGTPRRSCPAAPDDPVRRHGLLPGLLTPSPSRRVGAPPLSPSWRPSPLAELARPPPLAELARNRGPRPRNRTNRPDGGAPTRPGQGARPDTTRWRSPRGSTASPSRPLSSSCRSTSSGR